MTDLDLFGDPSPPPGKAEVGYLWSGSSTRTATGAAPVIEIATGKIIEGACG